MNKTKFKLLKKTKSQALKCKTCNKSFPYNSSLIKHKRIHTGERPYICNVNGCILRFSQVSNLLRHKKIHDGFKPFICETCGKKFSSSSNLHQHQSIHNLRKKRSKYICFVNDCIKSYFYICTLKKHFLSCHKVEYNKIVDIFSEKNFSHFFKKNNKKRLLEDRFQFVNFKCKNSIRDKSNNNNLSEEILIDGIYDDIKIEEEIYSHPQNNYVLIKKNSKESSENLKINNPSESWIKYQDNYLNNNDNLLTNNPEDFLDSNYIKDNYYLKKCVHMMELRLEILMKFSFLDDLKVILNRQSNNMYDMVKMLYSDK